ncbi:uncharacterized protein LOC113859999, partial [Abrus precatorius]|uniref:Uncharacterized protein LOC113859999 n=1 Tax=Abrus precatorius TaxID=3816 RepID=A0A8B8KYK1_ABRPR
NGISKTEVNLRRLLAAAPQQLNQAKLVHYVATLREQLEQLAEERTQEGLPRIVRRSRTRIPIEHRFRQFKLRFWNKPDTPCDLYLSDAKLHRIANHAILTSMILTEILDSTEKAIEHSLARRATAIYSESSKTSCLTWLVMFVMTCVFVMVILLIRVT